MTNNLSQVLDQLLSETVDAAKEREASKFAFVAGARAGSIVLFGAGGLGRQTLAGLRADGVEPVAFADNNPDRWNTSIDGVPVLSPADAAERHGASSVFVVTIWGAGSTHRFEHSVAQLRDLGCACVVPVAWLAWAHPERLLPHYAMNLPSRLVEQRDAVRRAFNRLADDHSRAEFVEQVFWRLTGDPTCLSHPVVGTQYLVADVADPIVGEVVLDCGAYNGDTLASWLADRGPTFERYVAMEPDPSSYAQLDSYVTGLDPEVARRIVIAPYAAAARPGVATFSALGTVSSFLGNDGEGVTVECARIDDILTQLDDVVPTFLMMDIEGAELGALAGAARLLSEHAPVVAVSAYHRQDHLWRVLNVLAEIQPSYRFFLRAHNEEGWDLVLYAVPPHRVPACVEEA
jgi:FkbM family methyltransferase